jgi:hypothetical protein
MRKTIGRIGCATLLLACLVGLSDRALAQVTTPKEDPAKAAQATKAIRAYISFLADEGSSAANDENCERLKFWIRRLDDFSTAFDVEQYARKTHGVILRPIGEDLASPLADYALVLRNDLLRQYLKICGPPQDEEEETETEISLGGGYSNLWLPQLSFGGSEAREEDEGEPGTGRHDQLDGGNASFRLKAPLGGQGTSFYLGYSGSWYDGSSRAAIPSQDADVGIRTEVDIDDVSLGFGRRLGILPSYLDGKAFLGARYIDIDRSDRIDDDESLLLSIPSIEQISRMWGPQVSIEADNRPAPDGGLTYGGKGSLGFLGGDTSINLRPLGDLRTENLNGSNFSVAVDLEAYIGYRFNKSAELRFFADLLYITDVPYTRLLLTPGDGVGTDLDNLTQLVFGSRFIWRPSYFHYHRPKQLY